MGLARGNCYAARHRALRHQHPNALRQIRTINEDTARRKRGSSSGAQGCESALLKIGRLRRRSTGIERAQIRRAHSATRSVYASRELRGCLRPQITTCV